jgi:hypothetical protein
VTRRNCGILVAAALGGAWRPSPPEFPLSEEELARITPILLATGDAGLVWRRIRHTALAASEPGRRLQDGYRSQGLRTAFKERDLLRVVALLREHGVDPLVFKGWNAARLYPERALRPYVDIDLCVREAEYARAEAALAAEKGLVSLVEISAGYPRMFDRTPEELYERSQLIPFGDVPIRVPCPEDHLRFQCRHMWEDGAWRPLWLCDLAAALESRPPGFHWDRLMEGNRRYSEWVACALLLARDLLGARLEGTPLAGEKRRLPRWLAPAVLRQWETCLQPIANRHLGEALRDRRQGPAALAAEIRRHWRNPIRATVDLRAPFNSLPRAPFQLLATVGRAPHFLRQILASRRGEARSVTPGGGAADVSPAADTDWEVSEICR